MSEENGFYLTVRRGLIIAFLLATLAQISVFLFGSLWPSVDVPQSILNVYESDSRRFWEIYKPHSLSDLEEFNFKKNIQELNYDAVLLSLQNKNLHDKPSGHYVLAQVAALAGEPYSQRIKPEWLQEIKSANSGLNPSAEALYLIEKAVYGKPESQEVTVYDDIFNSKNITLKVVGITIVLTSLAFVIVVMWTAGMSVCAFFAYIKNFKKILSKEA